MSFEGIPQRVEFALEFIHVADDFLAGEVGRPLVEVGAGLVGVDRPCDFVWLEHYLEVFGVEVVGHVLPKADELLVGHLGKDILAEFHDEAEGFVLSVVGDWCVHW